MSHPRQRISLWPDKATVLADSAKSWAESRTNLEMWQVIFQKRRKDEENEYLSKGVRLLIFEKILTSQLHVEPDKIKMIENVMH